MIRVSAVTHQCGARGRVRGIWRTRFLPSSASSPQQERTDSPGWRADERELHIPRRKQKPQHGRSYIHHFSTSSSVCSSSSSSVDSALCRALRFLPRVWREKREKRERERAPPLSFFLTLSLPLSPPSVLFFHHVLLCPALHSLNFGLFASSLQQQLFHSQLIYSKIISPTV